MDVICLPTTAWLEHQSTCLSLLSRAARTHRAESVFLHLELDAVLRESALEPEDPPHSIHEILFATWIRDGVTEDGVLDVEIIRKAPYGFPDGATVLVNGAGFKSEIIAQALFQARLALYPLPSWPRLFVMVVDDAQLFQISPILANTFYIQPGILIHTAIDREIRQLCRSATILRVFGRYYALSALRDIFALVDKWITKREQKKTRGLGWTWEE